MFEKLATMHDLETKICFEDIVKMNAILDMKDNVRRIQHEDSMRKNK